MTHIALRADKRLISDNSHKTAIYLTPPNPQPMISRRRIFFHIATITASELASFGGIKAGDSARIA